MEYVGLIGADIEAVGWLFLGEYAEYDVLGFTKGWRDYLCLDVKVVSNVGYGTYYTSHYPADLLTPLQQRRLKQRLGAYKHKECEFLEGLDCLVTT